MYVIFKEKYSNILLVPWNVPNNKKRQTHYECKQYPLVSHIPLGAVPQVPALAIHIAPPQGGHCDMESVSEREIYP